MSFTPRVRRPGQVGKIAFYGCAAGGEGRLVRVGLVGEGKPPRAVTVDCPVCGASHPVDLQWRQPVEVDEDREPELYVESGAPDQGGAK